MTANNSLAGIQLLPLPMVARLMNVSTRDLLKMMAAENISVIQYSERRRSIRMTDIDKLIASMEKRPVPNGL